MPAPSRALLSLGRLSEPRQWGCLESRRLGAGGDVKHAREDAGMAGRRPAPRGRRCSTAMAVLSLGTDHFSATADYAAK
jgi:hypothetical protein